MSSAMSDATAKESVRQCLIQAKKNISNALLWPRGMSVEDFHDLTNMRDIIGEMLGEKNAK